jgi:nanoRNase/pAp phosphatase (c-di-AMP/oligoRNAs hydrolase)
MYSSIFEEIKKYDKIVIARHIGVDPDAWASQVALRDAIKATFPNKSVYAVGNSSSKFNYFPKLDRMPSELDGLLIVVDTPDKKRVDLPDFSNFSKISLDAFGANFSIAKASSISLPLIRSATILTFLLDILAYLKVASAD